MGRSSMHRVRPLLLAMNGLRRIEEERERGPGVIPGRGRGVDIRTRNDGEQVPGRESNSVFMGKSRQFPAPIDTEIRKQPYTQLHCLVLASRSQSQPVAPTPIFFKVPLPCVTPILPHSHPAPVIICTPAIDCHQPHPLPIMVNRRLHQSQKTLMSLSPCIYK